MPKMKTKKAASKRFKVRAGGSIKRAHATKRHILTHRSTKNKRHLRGMVTIHESGSTLELAAGILSMETNPRDYEED